MAAQIYYDKDADLALIRGKKVAIIGYGSQGHAHALNLKDSGVDVRVGLRAGEHEPRQGEGRRPRRRSPSPRPPRGPTSIMMLAPDTAQPTIYKNDIAPHLDAGQDADVRARLQHPLRHDRAAGRRRRHDDRAEGARPPRARDVPGGRRRAGAGRRPPGRQRQRARRWRCRTPRRIGVTRAGVLETTFAEETETDLFGEQAVLCGGVSALVKAGFETLVEAGYQPEVAYFECLHELKLIVDLMYRGGLNYMRYSVSDTAEYGDYVAGPRVVDRETRKAMKQLLAEIQDGTFAQEVDRGERGRAARRSTRERKAEQDAAARRRSAPSCAR